ncbi:MAG: hypothetical protein WCF22_01740 [Candidatus Sulfotelmatobacter sp.]
MESQNHGGNEKNPAAHSKQRSQKPREACRSKQPQHETVRVLHYSVFDDDCGKPDKGKIRHLHDDKWLLSRQKMDMVRMSMVLRLVAHADVPKWIPLSELGMHSCNLAHPKVKQ